MTAHCHDLFADHSGGCPACDSVIADAYDAAPVSMAVRDVVDGIDAWYAANRGLPPVVTGPVLGWALNLREALRRKAEGA